MSDLSDQEVYQAVGAIAGRYEVLKCYECAKATLKWLRKNNLEGKVIRLETRFGELYILSNRMVEQGYMDSITDNGIHYAVEVRGWVFDNLSSNGMLREEWLMDFSCPSGEFLVQDLEGL